MKEPFSAKLKQYLEDRELVLDHVSLSRDALMRPGEPRTEEEIETLVEEACEEILLNMIFEETADPVAFKEKYGTEKSS